MPDPLFRSVPAFEWTNGDLAAGLGEQVGMTPDDDQRAILDAIFAEDEAGDPVCFGVGVVAPRQNIKTSTFEIAALSYLFDHRVPLQIWTAHLFDTARKSFEHMVELVENTDDLRRRCRRPRTANGSEAIELLTGEQIAFYARSKGGGRGIAGDKVYLDEALFLAGTAVGALLPTMATRRGAQVFYGSSGGLTSSEVLRGVRDRGRSGADPALAYFEWGAQRAPCEQDGCPHLPAFGVPGCALDREDLWAQANPALGRRITVERLRQFRRSMPPEEFAREFLTWWEDPVLAEQALDPAAWARLVDRGSSRSGPLALAVSVAPDRSRSVVAAAGWRADGLAHVELARVDHGVGWLLPFLLRVVARKDPLAVALRKNGPAGSLIVPLANVGVEAMALGAQDVAQASAGFFDAVTETGAVRHLGDPLLTEAVRAATKRGPDDGWSFEVKDARDVPLEAAVLAFRALVASGRPVAPPPAPRVIRADAAPNTSTFATAGF